MFIVDDKEKDNWWESCTNIPYNEDEDERDQDFLKRKECIAHSAPNNLPIIEGVPTKVSFIFYNGGKSFIITKEWYDTSGNIVDVAILYEEPTLTSAFNITGATTKPVNELRLIPTKTK